MSSLNEDKTCPLLSSLKWKNLKEDHPGLDTVFICRKVGYPLFLFEALIEMESDSYENPAPYQVLINLSNDDCLGDYWRVYEWAEMPEENKSE